MAFYGLSLVLLSGYTGIDNNGNINGLVDMSDDAREFRFYDNREKKDARHWDFERYYRIERIVALFIIALVVSMFLLVVAVVVFPILGCL